MKDVVASIRSSEKFTLLDIRTELQFEIDEDSVYSVVLIPLFTHIWFGLRQSYVLVQ